MSDSVALFGGVYNNHAALRALLEDVRARGISGLFCLGDLGGFGPSPDKVFPLIREAGVPCLQGNYDHSISNGLDDCGCGYADPRDNYYAQLTYDYTRVHTSAPNRDWMKTLPPQATIEVGRRRVHLCHGSPRRTSEFLWDSTTPDGLLVRFLDDAGTDALAFTHTGLKWHRRLADGRSAVNVGVIGRPENDGRTNVWYTVLRDGPELGVEFVPLDYDAEALAREMEAEALPPEFAETIRTGWWTTCLEVLPSKERARGKF